MFLYFSLQFLLPCVTLTLITYCNTFLTGYTHITHVSVVFVCACKGGGGPRWRHSPGRGGGRWAVEDAEGLLKVLLREWLAAVPDRLGMEGQMVFD